MNEFIQRVKSGVAIIASAKTLALGWLQDWGA
jgi:hypothetical protein